MKRLRKILVANRGEIACRVLRAARELGVGTVAVYADQDRGAPHVFLADESFPLEGRSPEETYLDVKKILSIARDSRADSVHPGYGFLAENPDFARRLTDSGLQFVGPPPETLRLSGSKVEARERVKKAGVPVLPNHRGPLESFRQAAERIGFPLLVKAAAGGGGRGIRRVDNASQIEQLAQSASREALKFFGDGEVYLEKEISRARHVEFQILADTHGKVVELGERDCSIQRRYQKVVEESPSPILEPELRRKMADAALRAARAIGYQNAGTIEFLLEMDVRGRPQGFYFLEVNARIQVEHPVTELLTGEDLVGWQIRIAAGERLPDRLDTLEPRGHAIECRVCAERPPDFLPSCGRLLRLDPPRGPGVRFDAGYSQGDTVPSEFDSLIGKVVVHAPNRTEAIGRMIVSLEEATFLGVDTNQDFLVDILGNKRFQEGVYTTRFLQEEMSEWMPPAASAEVNIIARATLDEEARRATGTTGYQGPWESLGGWPAQETSR